MSDKKLTRAADGKLFGVCGGLANYFGLDATLVRVIWLLLVFCAGTGILAYIILAILMPKA